MIQCQGIGLVGDKKGLRKRVGEGGYRKCGRVGDRCKPTRTVTRQQAPKTKPQRGPASLEALCCSPCADRGYGADGGWRFLGFRQAVSGGLDWVAGRVGKRAGRGRRRMGWLAWRQ